MVLANLKQRNQISLEPIIVDKSKRLRLFSGNKSQKVVGSLIQRIKMLIPLVFKISEVAGFSIRSQNLEALT